MKPQTRNGKTAAGHAVRPSVVILSFLGVLAALGLGITFWARKDSTRPARQAQSQPPPLAQDPSQGSGASPEDDGLPVLVTNRPAGPSAGKSGLAPKRQATTGSSPAPAPRAEPSPYTRQLVTSLVNLEQAGPPSTPEQAAAWKQNLQQLIQQGSASLPAIREYLEKNVDYTFGSEGARALGYGSARSAMFDALVQIGGADSINLLLDTLQATGEPREIAQLARGLEQLAPEQYRQQILDASRQVLAAPSDSQAAAQLDVAPLFELLAKYGGPSAAADLSENASRWKYYSAIALAQLPDGAGIPSLIQMVQDSGGGPVKNIPALEMLTQLAGQNDEARAALLQQARANAISPNTWAYLASILAGDQIRYLDSGALPLPSNDLKTFHIAAGNQNFYAAPPAGGLSPEQISQQLALIDQLMGATSNPAVQQTLQASRDLLLKRGAQPATGTRP